MSKKVINFNIKSEYISFPSSCEVNVIDNIFNLYFKKFYKDTKSLTLDFSNTTFIEMISLMHLNSIISYNITKIPEINIELPKKKEVRDFLRSWEYPKAIKEVTGLNFSDLVTEKSLAYFGENETKKDNKYSGYLFFNDSGDLDRLLNNYFPFLTFFINYQNNTNEEEYEFNVQLALEEADRWKKNLMVSFLQEYLNGPENYFSSRIVFEAMFNAIRHPNAKLIQTSSYMQYNDTSKYFTLSWWDNGNSIIKTLQTTLENEGTIVNDKEIYNKLISYYLINETININKQNTEISFVENTGEKILSNLNINESISDENLLLAAIMPGVSCDTKGIGHKTHPKLGNEYDNSQNKSTFDENFPIKAPGMGLSLLINTVVKIYKGSVAIRTNNYFMNIRNPKKTETDKEVDYIVKIRKYDNTYEFPGNMLTVRLPLT